MSEKLKELARQIVGYSIKVEKGMYNRRGFSRNYGLNQNQDRFVGGFFGPLLLGGIAGYAIGNQLPRSL